VELDVHGVRMHYVDEGSGPPVLLLHGEPTSSFLWRKLIPPLVAAGHRAIAPDLIGFGRSDKPEDVGWYSYDGHVESVVRLVDALHLRALTLVVHDWGGPIGLRFAVDHPARVDRLVILNTGIGGGRAPSEAWLRFREVVRAQGASIDPVRLIEAGTVRGLSDEARAGYALPFPTPVSKAGLLAFPELVPAEPDHSNAAPMNRVRDALRRWEKPALVVWGAEDRVLPPALAHAFVQLIPGAEGPILIEGAGHFLQEDRPEDLAAAILRFLAEHESPDRSGG
jgi:haloalkane dehalogenase